MFVFCIYYDIVFVMYYLPMETVNSTYISRNFYSKLNVITYNKGSALLFLELNNIPTIPKQKKNVILNLLSLGSLFLNNI